MNVDIDFSDVANILLSFWRFQLFIVDGNPITLGKLITGIILLIIGINLSKKLTVQIEKQVLSRLEN